LKRWVHGTDDLPLAEMLSATGVHWATENAGFAAALGLRLSEGPVSGVQVKSVLAGTAAQRAGVSAGDELIAINGWRIRRIDDALGWIDPAKPFELMLVRDQRVLTLKVDPRAGPALTQTVQLSLVAKPGRAQAARRRAWLRT
jgi:predicted metalloprotease with PDZ domain